MPATLRRERCAELVVRAEHVLCVLPCLPTFAAETRLNQKQNLIVAALRGISAKQEVNNQAACTHIHTPMCMYICVCFVTTQTELSDVLLCVCCSLLNDMRASPTDAIHEKYNKIQH